MKLLRASLVIVTALVALQAVATALERAAQDSAAVPRFEVDPTWPKLPPQWILGQVSGVAVDARDPRLREPVFHRDFHLLGPEPEREEALLGAASVARVVDPAGGAAVVATEPPCGLVQHETRVAARAARDPARLLHPGHRVRHPAARGQRGVREDAHPQRAVRTVGSAVALRGLDGS